MIVRIYDEAHTFPACLRGGEGGVEVDFNASPRAEDGYISMTVSGGVFGGKWGAACAFMSPDEAKKLARDLLVAAGEVEPYYGA